MNNKTTANYAKIAVIVVALAVALSCTVGGTLAAFSATYTWTSDNATAGDMAYTDTQYALDLFGGGSVAPGDSGSAPLNGVDFGSAPVEWTFSSDNADIMPVVFYTLAEDGAPEAASFYSEYAFDGMDDLYAACPDGTPVRLGDISDDVNAVAASLAVGKTLCWVWFDTVYTDSALQTAATGAAVDAYVAYCASICESEYAFSENIAAESGSMLVSAFVVGQTGDTLSYRACDLSQSALSVRDGLLYVGEEVAYVEDSGMFRKPTSSAELTADSAVWLLVVASNSAEFEALLDGVRYENLGKYALQGSGDADGTAVPDASGGNRVLYKLYPERTGGVRAEISVTITATVSF